MDYQEKKRLTQAADDFLHTPIETDLKLPCGGKKIGTIMRAIPLWLGVERIGAKTRNNTEMVDHLNVATKDVAALLAALQLAKERKFEGHSQEIKIMQKLKGGAAVFDRARKLMRMIEKELAEKKSLLTRHLKTVTDPETREHLEDINQNLNTLMDQDDKMIDAIDKLGAAYKQTIGQLLREGRSP